MPKCKPVETPFIVVIDTREQRPYGFEGITADAKAGGGPLIVKTTVATLRSGDYSLVVPEGGYFAVAIERKSPEDFFHTLGQGRDRFERELARLNELEFAKVVVEAEWSQLLSDPPERSKLNPKTAWRSVLAWQQRFPRVHWDFCFSREFAEVTTLRTLERFWKEQEDKKNAVS